MADAICDVCGSAESSKKNPIIFCDGEDCDIPVHIKCYNLKKVPSDEENWYCDKCTIEQDGIKRNPLCCDNPEGIYKKTSTNPGYIHVVCGFYNPAINTGERLYQSDGSIKLPDKLPETETCYICKKRSGFTVRCNHEYRGEGTRCLRSFHVTCALENGLVHMSDVTVMEKFSPSKCLVCEKHYVEVPEDEDSPKSKPVKSSLKRKRKLSTDPESESDSASSEVIKSPKRRNSQQSNDSLSSSRSGRSMNSKASTSVFDAFADSSSDSDDSAKKSSKSAVKRGNNTNSRPPIDRNFAVGEKVIPKKASLITFGLDTNIFPAKSESIGPSDTYKPNVTPTSATTGLPSSKSEDSKELADEIDESFAQLSQVLKKWQREGSLKIPQTELRHKFNSHFPPNLRVTQLMSDLLSHQPSLSLAQDSITSSITTKSKPSLTSASSISHPNDTNLRQNLNQILSWLQLPGLPKYEEKRLDEYVDCLAGIVQRVASKECNGNGISANLAKQMKAEKSNGEL